MSKFVQIIQPSGEIDCNKVALLHQEILSFVNREITIILIDFCDAIAISSESIDSLYNIYQCVKEYGGSLYFCALSPEVKKTSRDLILDWTSLP